MVYLIFNEGYAETAGPSLTRADLCTGAIRLGRLVVELMGEPEAIGSACPRRGTRVEAAGDLVLLEDQDRSLWDRGRIKEAPDLIEQALVRTNVTAPLDF
ncbi:DUF6596 domain-containing protein [Phyllobacterium sp. P5_D12]